MLIWLGAVGGANQKSDGALAGQDIPYVCWALWRFQLVWLLGKGSHLCPCLEQTSWETSRAVGLGSRHSDLPWVQIEAQTGRVILLTNVVRASDGLWGSCPFHLISQKPPGWKSPRNLVTRRIMNLYPGSHCQTSLGSPRECLY